MEKKVITAAVIVNYFSAKFTVEAARSVLSSQSSGSLKVIVVDNSCDKNEREYLTAHLPEKASLILNDENSGFGRACNYVFENTDSDFFLLLNPDALLVGDSLILLEETLMCNESAGAVTPQAFWDERMIFFIPPAHDPLLFFIQPEMLHFGSGTNFYSLLAKLWRRYSIKVWTASKTLQVKNICGGHVLLKRDAVLKAGGLFDPAFFMYFEDTDLFLRLRMSGYKLLLNPRSKAIHHYDQCDPGGRKRKSSYMLQSHKQFIDKHDCFKIFLQRKFVRAASRLNIGIRPEKLISVSSPLKIPAPESAHQKLLLEWSPNRDFIPSIGCFWDGSSVFQDNDLGKLAPGTYYFRYGELGSLRLPENIFMWIKE